MKINIYDKDLNRVLDIGERFVSCLWAEGYNSAQPFTLELQENDETRKKIRTDFYVGRNDRKSLMVIKSVEYANNKIVINGKQASRVLADVAFVGKISENKDIATSVKGAYDSTGGFPLVEFEEGELGVKYKSQISNKSVLELCETMCQEEDAGFYANKNGNKISIGFYKPEENPNLVFSTSFGNLKVDSVFLSTENYKNYAIVLGAGEGEERKRVDVDLSNGGQKRQIIIDAKDIIFEENDTEDGYMEKLRARGIENLLSQKNVFKCSFSPSDEDFGSRFDLGDVLLVNIQEYGIKLKARVVRFSQKEQNNKTDTVIEVGQMIFKR